jgi:hypothetical protein
MLSLKVESREIFMVKRGKQAKDVWVRVGGCGLLSCQLGIDKLAERGSGFVINRLDRSCWAETSLDSARNGVKETNLAPLTRADRVKIIVVGIISI